jgi:MYXO-CTERM domain-containing protein
MPLDPRDLDLLSAYIDDALSADERAALELRLQADSVLSRELERLQATVALLRDLPALKSPRDLRVTREQVAPPRILLFPATYAFSAISAAAAVVLLLAGVILLSARLPRAASPGDQVAIAPTQAVPATMVSGQDIAPTFVATTLDTFAEEAEQAVEAPSPVEDDEAEDEAADSIAVQPTLLPVASALPDGAVGEAAGGAPEAGVLAEEPPAEPPIARFAAETPSPAAALELAPAAAQAVTETPTLAPTATKTPIPTSTSTLTATPTFSSVPPSPTATPVPIPAVSTDEGAAGIGLIAAAVLLLILAAAALIVRRRV